MDVRLELFDPKNVTNEQWKTFHEFRKVYYDENSTDKPFIEDEQSQKMIISSSTIEDRKNLRYLMISGTEIVGRIYIGFFTEKSPSYDEKKHELDFEVEILRKARKQGLGTKALNKVIEIAKQNERTLILSHSDNDDGKAFLDKIGAERALITRENRLYFKDIDWQMVEKWEKESKEKNPNTELRFFNSVPEDIIDSFVKTANFAGNQDPHENLQTGKFILTPESLRKMEERIKSDGAIFEQAATVETDGTVSGLTFFIYLLGAEFLSQGLTAVLEDYRGHGLGKWLKASLLLHVRKYQKVEFIVTVNAEVNAPMLNINKRLGFKKHKEIIRYQISLDTISTYLESKNIVISKVSDINKTNR